MVNFHDPVQIRQNFGAYASLTWLPKTYFDHPLTETMENIQAIACGLYLWVDVAPCAPTVYHTAYSSSAFRWEFITTLDYEWNVIRGRQPYRWTIWVRTYWFL